MQFQRSVHPGPDCYQYRSSGVGGLPDSLIEYLPSLLNEAIQFFSCFISYSSNDQEFADRLYADLQPVRTRRSEDR
jgi:hypothetical protein